MYCLWPRAWLIGHCLLLVGLDLHQHGPQEKAARAGMWRRGASGVRFFIILSYVFEFGSCRTCLWSETEIHFGGTASWEMMWGHDKMTSSCERNHVHVKLNPFDSTIYWRILQIHGRHTTLKTNNRVSWLPVDIVKTRSQNLWFPIHVVEW